MLTLHQGRLPTNLQPTRQAPVRHSLQCDESAKLDKVATPAQTRGRSSAWPLKRSHSPRLERGQKQSPCSKLLTCSKRYSNEYKSDEITHHEAKVYYATLPPLRLEHDVMERLAYKHRIHSRHNYDHGHDVDSRTTRLGWKQTAEFRCTIFRYSWCRGHGREHVWITNTGANQRTDG